MTETQEKAKKYLEESEHDLLLIRDILSELERHLGTVDDEWDAAIMNRAKHIQDTLRGLL